MLDTTRINPALAQLLVVDAMHPGVITSRPDEPICTAARLMATYCVHAVFVAARRDGEDGDRWRVVTDTALLRASEEGTMDEVTAGAIVETPVFSVASSDDLGAADHLRRPRRLAPGRRRAALEAAAGRALDARRRPGVRRLPGEPPQR